MSDAITVVEGLDFIVSLAEGHVHPDDLDAARRAAAAARMRAGHLGATMVLALVGGTGSGKSSLLNALAGEEVASTSALRPHTAEPLAWVPEDAEPSLSQLLDRLGISQRVSQSRLPGLAILDMTDIDSVAFEHRARVEMLLPDVDVIVWVLDPEKYADPGLHSGFIAPLAGSSDRLVFVLNQIDRLASEAVDIVADDLAGLLVADGVADPVVFAVAAAPGSGSPLGVDLLEEHLVDRLDEKRVHLGKLIDDARSAARSLAGAAGVGAGGSLEFEDGWLALRDAVVTDYATGGGDGARLEALRLVEGMILRLSAEAGGLFGVRIRQTFEPARIEEEVAAAFAASAQSTDGAATLDSELQERIGAPLRKMLWERASLSAVVAGLAVDASQADRALGRVGD